MTISGRLPDGLELQFKTGQFSKKTTWRNVPLAGLIPFCKGIKVRKFESGQMAIWLLPIVTDRDGKAYDWTILDVENTEEHHKSIAANLESGRVLLRNIIEHGLEAGLVIWLSGKGLRFCWPYLIQPELQKAFRAWITDKASFPMIDPSPFIKKVFFRFLANRNHSNQGAVLNRHIHRLDSIHDLWFLAEQDYLALVTGTVDLGTSLIWLQEVLPSSFTPNSWGKFLNDYKRQTVLSATIFRPLIPSRRFRKPIIEIADQLGIQYRSQTWGDSEILKLAVCPICGRTDGNAYLTKNGRLKCYHWTCEAGQIGDRGLIGMSLSKWLPGEQADEFELVVPDEQVERISIEAGREALSEAFKSKEDTYVTLSPGAGKSFTMILGIVAELNEGKVAIATPEHRLNQEFYDMARGMTDHPEKVHFLQGRNSSNCERILKVESVARSGFSPGVIVCSNCSIKKNSNCGYLKQFQSLKNKSGLWLLTHAMALEIDFAKYKFTLLVIDESPLKTFLQKQSAPHGAMMRIQSKLESEGRAVMEKIMAVVPMQLEALERENANKYDLSRIYASEPPKDSPWAGNPDICAVAELTINDSDIFDRALDIFARFDGESVSRWQKRLFFEKVDMSALRWLWAALSGKPGLYIRFKKDRENPAKFISFTKRLPRHSSRIIALDATGTLGEIESLFEHKFWHVQGRVLMPGIRTAWIKQNSGKILMSRMSDKKITAMMKAAGEFLNPDDQKVLIVTHMVVEESVKRLAGDILHGREIMTCHFWGGSRGVNKFSECTAVIAMGTPFPNIGGLFDHAMALMSSPAERMQWIVDTGTAELVQALHRIRPVKGNRTVIVVGRDFPVAEFGNPDFKLNLGRGNKAAETSISEIIERLSPFVERWGFMTKEVGWAFKVTSEADKGKAIQTAEYIQDCINELEKQGYNLPDLLGKSDNDEKGTLPRCVYLLEILLVGKRIFDAILSHHYLIFPNHSTWNAVLNLLAERFKLPKLTTLSTSTRGQQVHGVGYLSSVRKFLVAAHLPPDSFKNIEGIESPERENEKHETTITGR